MVKYKGKEYVTLCSTASLLSIIIIIDSDKPRPSLVPQPLMDESAAMSLHAKLPDEPRIM